ncbi:MAG: SDR family NAD(P)-dependent oxidoreductase [Deltaproteobacteria bacterium]|nr:MAG: SDR family NAD(P)-dependent oxidoreductase [Deltaproteobacteria bacterium]
MVQGVEHGAAPGRYASWGIVDLAAVTLPLPLDPQIAVAAARGGEIGIVDLEWIDDPHAARAPIRRLVREGGDRVGLKLRASSRGLVDLLEDLAPRLDVVVLVRGNAEENEAALDRLRRVARRVLLEARSAEEAAIGEELGFDGLVAKGSEGGGWIGNETSLVLLQRLVARGRLPVWAHGGVGLHSIAACFAAGAAGAIVDAPLALSRESPLGDDVRAALARADGSEAVCLGEALARPFRVFGRAGDATVRDLRALAEALERSPAPVAERRGQWEIEVRRRIGSRHYAILPLGQDIAFAASLAGRYPTVAGILYALRTSLGAHVRIAKRLEPLAEGSPLARAHGTRFPIVQGPMTRVSDTPEFAARIAEAGALPFVALALKRGSELGELLQGTIAALGSKPWGAGILGFVPADVRAEQLAAVAVHRPPFALIAGARPDQALGLGGPSYVHVPTVALLASFLEQGARRFVFEGRECGGHVGPLSSMVLWDRAVDELLEWLTRENRETAEDCHVLFAGGIHDARSAAMVAALASPLAARGVRVGVLVGTAYLFTREVVESGAIARGFQDEAIRCASTVLLESGDGHATRCAPTPYAEEFRDRRGELLEKRCAPEELKNELERMNLGRLRIAAKGIERTTRTITDGSAPLAPVTNEEQRARGLYMMGQVAALRDATCTLEELHREISTGSTERLRSLALPCEVRRASRTSTADAAIVGMACLLPGAPSLHAFWDNILKGADAIVEIPKEHWDYRLCFDPEGSAGTGKMRSRWGGFLEPTLFDPVRYGIPPRSIPSIEPAQLLALDRVAAALEDAGYRGQDGPRTKTSVIFGSPGATGVLSGRFALRSWLPFLGDKALAPVEPLLPDWSEDTLPGTIGNLVPGRIANRFDLGGLNFTVDAACASSLAALHVGARELASFSSDLVIVGATDMNQGAGAYLSFGALGALSPTGRCRSFDHRADGIVLSEGIAVVILKRLEDAERDGDRIYAVLRGSAGSSDGRMLGLTAPRVEGQVSALERAYTAAGVSSASVQLVEAHGTGTIAGDAAEIAALATVFDGAGAAKQSCAIGSVKSMIGHTRTTAGLAALIKSALALHHKVLPATLHVERPNPELRLDATAFYPNVEARPWFSPISGELRRAAVSAFGFGGTNFHAVLEEAPAARAALSRDAVSRAWPAELVVMRAPSAPDLLAQLDQVERIVASSSPPTLAEVASAAASERRGGVALAVVATSAADARAKLTRARSEIARGSERLADPTGIYYAREPAMSRAGAKLAFLFPGQGSQYVEMGRELAVHFDDVRAAFERADATLEGQLARPLTRFVFPPPAFSMEGAQAAATALAAPDVAQPALGAIGMGMNRLLTDHLGIEPHMVGGHSYGEYVALCAGGALGEDDLYSLSHARGRIMAAALPEGSRGAMAAVEASPELLAELLGVLEDLWIANVNGPRQTVISGTSTAIDAAIARLAARGVSTRALPVACAFHSPLMAPARDPLARELRRIRFAEPHTRVFSNVTSAPYGPEIDPVSTLSEHVVRPIDFSALVRAMYEAGARVFVEVGPHDVLSGLVDQILEGRSVAAVPIDVQGRGGLTQLLHALARLAADGVTIRAERLFEGRVTETRTLDALEEHCRHRPGPPATAWKIDSAGATPIVKNAVAKNELRSTTESTSGAASARREMQPRLDPLPEALPTRDASTGSAASDVIMTRWQGLMESFLAVQRDVMLAFLRQGEATAETQEPEPGRREADALATPVGSAVAETPAKSAQTSTHSPANAHAHDLRPSATNHIAAPTDREQLLSLLRGIVSDKTGYPVEALGAELKLDADLGLGSLKRLEVLSALPAKLSLSHEALRSAMEHLTKQRTLASLADSILPFLTTTLGDAPGPGLRHVLVPTLTAPGKPERLMNGAIVITDDERGVARALEDEVRASGAHAVVLRHRRRADGAGAEDLLVDLVDPDAVMRAIDQIRRRHGSIGGLFHLLPLREDASPAHGIETLRARIDAEVKGLYHLARALAPDLGASAAGACFLVAATSTGTFGSEDVVTGDAPVQGAISGMVKALAHEWPGTCCKAIDLRLDGEPLTPARVLLRESQSNGVDVELGYRGSQRIALRAATRELGASAQRATIDRSWIVLVTGGARGITAEVARELASRYRPTLVVVGRSSPAPEESSDTARFASRTCERILRERQVRASLAALAETGATVRYVTADVREEAAFGALIDDLYATYGRIDGVVHGAGVVEDRLIEDKDAESFDRVFSTKVASALVLAQKLRPESLKWLAFFSSISGTFGNRGQSDYAAANAFLDRLAAYLDRKWPARVVSIAWSPWALETGMVTAEVRRHLEARGLHFLSVSEGRRIAERELVCGAKGEAEVILGRLPPGLEG